MYNFLFMISGNLEFGIWPHFHDFIIDPIDKEETILISALPKQIAHTENGNK